MEIGDTLHKVVDLDDQLDDEVALVNLLLETECQDANRLVFIASFSDSSSAVYLATVALLGDLDGDDSVGTADLLALLSAWGTDPGGPPDFNGDGNVGTSDLLVLLANWG